jgi:glycosyltransferase involved in cell wall biosynthesis
VDSVGPSVSIVIPSRNRAKLLEVLVDTIAKQLGPLDSLVVVDDGSIPPYDLDPNDRVLTIRNARSVGLNNARNVGVAACTGEVILFLDDDVLEVDDIVSRTRAAWKVDPTVAVIGGTVDVLAEPPNYRLCAHCSIDYPLPSARRKEVSWWSIWGCSFSVARTALKAVGPFPIEARIGGDEQAWLYRCEQAGLRLVIDPALSVLHDKRGVTRSRSRLMRTRAGRGRNQAWNSIRFGYERRTTRADCTRTAVALRHAAAKLCWGGLFEAAQYASRALWRQLYKIRMRVQ